MKLLAFSDLHRDINAARTIVSASADADVVVGAGDFSTRSFGLHDTLDILVHCKAPLILVHGNHDNAPELAQQCKSDANIHYLHGQSVSISGTTFFGFGGDTHPNGGVSKNHSISEAEAAQYLAPCPQGVILVTHTPPNGIADLYEDGTHGGSTAVRDAIEATTPRLTLCGHIHNSWGAEGHIGASHIRNLGPAPVWFDL
ncbi:MAG: metallophosphoesterase [Litoreibacter sp.]|uniref:metallophosphoesterase family protein n=1 Tax=Litoreibacter sp. TaxID=1969459 RepID=UPI003297E860